MTDKHNAMQELQVSGELKPLMKQEDGRIELLLRTWIWLSELPSKDGNLFSSMISRYVTVISRRTTRQMRNAKVIN